jgi:prepilin-type N-terminal cleavage/methylation domain-containing protein
LSVLNSPNNRKSLKNPNQKGFTLVELIVSMAIASVLMVGLSTFFASTFHTLFQAQAESASTERQYAVNQIMADKFGNMKALASNIAGVANNILAYNNADGETLPFTYISTVDMCPMNSVENDNGTCQDKDSNPVTKEKRLAFKDLMPFNKIIKIGDDYAIGDMGTGGGDNDGGKIKKIGGVPNFRDVIKYQMGTNYVTIRNFAGFAQDGDGNFYIAVPDQDLILKCPKDDAVWCYKIEDFSAIGGLNKPTDLALDGTTLYFSDSGNNRIIKYPLEHPELVQPIAINLNFPTGLAFYSVGSTENYLFVADTFNNKVERISLNSSLTLKPIETVVGDGESDACDGTALFCKLNMPTGLFLDNTSTNKALYIADSGNSRILKMTDPGKPDVLKIQFELSKNYALDRIELNGDWSGGAYDNDASNLTGSSSNYKSATTPATTPMVFSNPDRFTAYTDSICATSGKDLYVNEDLSTISYPLQNRFIVVDGVGLKIINIPSDPSNEKDCTPTTDPPSPTIKKWKIEVDKDLPAGITTGMVVYPSNPKSPNPDLSENDTVIQIKNPTWTQTGFVTTEIKTYDISGGLAETDYQSTAVGDGVLGTVEDGIQPVAFNQGGEIAVVDEGGTRQNIPSAKIVFPTGVSDAYFANFNPPTENNIVNRLLPSNSLSFNPVNTSYANQDYDYIGDFPLDPLVPIAFSKYGSILEAVITTAPDSNGFKQVYRHDAVLKP